MNENLRQRDDTIRKKDEKLRELTFQVNILQQELRLKNQRLAQGFGVDAGSSKDGVKVSNSISADEGSQPPALPSSLPHNKTFAIATDETTIGSSQQAVSQPEKSSTRSKRAALGERTNSLANDVVPSNTTEVKKAVKIVDSTDNESSKPTKSVRIDA